jgi:hypothetical protein
MLLDFQSIKQPHKEERLFQRSRAHRIKQAVDVVGHERRQGCHQVHRPVFNFFEKPHDEDNYEHCKRQNRNQIEKSTVRGS